MNLKHVIIPVLFSIVSCRSGPGGEESPICISGIYPHLASYNHEDECGTGAVVPWADRLWVISYGPHLPYGSSDKLYEITPGLDRIIRPESIGGTPANRMIHRESQQLFIGPYAIDLKRNVRTIPYSSMTGRLTGNARHLLVPESKIYFASMEEGFYEVDVNTLEVSTLYKDGHLYQKEGDMSSYGALLPGAHGKGLYSGQGVLVYTNNGETSQEALQKFNIESGALAEWDGKDWKIVRRNQFVEVTGPGGIYGNSSPWEDPIWATGWDHKSVLIGVRHKGKWSFFRIPKASYSYDGAHGWNTEWPRIRDIGPEGVPDYLMTMHGLFWKFPSTFTGSASGGIRPRTAYLKVIGDFTRWEGRLVFGCDDAAKKEFLNKRKVKGNIEGPGQSNSNLWFTSPEMPDMLGPATASGAVWMEDSVNAGEYSEPFLFTGWDHRSSWIQNHSPFPVEIKFEIDRAGNGQWQATGKELLEGGESRFVGFSQSDQGEWIRVSPDVAARLTVCFTYTDQDERDSIPDEIFRGLSEIQKKPNTAGLLYGLGDDRRALGISSRIGGEPGGYYELNEMMEIESKDDVSTQRYMEEKFAVPRDVIILDGSSVLIIDDRNRRWRLPMGNPAYKPVLESDQMRLSREVATERDLFNCFGTFYELPAENADGFAKIRPVASHNFRIHDYASYRGMLIMTGIDLLESMGNPHVFVSEDGNAAVWAGVIDDLWKLGKPRGTGGPWKESLVEGGVPSDPYLIGFYDHKTMSLSHSNTEKILFTVEVEPLGHGPWMKYMQIEVEPGETYDHQFPDNFQARWIRFVTDKDCEATAWLEYR